jgi:hypothetical protein
MKKVLDLYQVLVLYLGVMGKKTKIKKKKKRLIEKYPFYNRLFNYNKKGKK